MYFGTKNQLNLIRWCWVVLLALSNTKFVQSVIVGPYPSNATCEAITYHKDQMYQCELTLSANAMPERLMVNFNRFHLNCTDTLYVYDGPSISGDPAFTLNCENQTDTIYSTSNSLSLELVTTNELGFDSQDFYVVYTPFTESENGCDGFVCRDENRYCIPREYECDSYDHCSGGSDEGTNCLSSYDDSGDMIKLIALVCFASFILFLGSIWLCAHTRKIMRNRAAIQRNGVANN